MTQAAFPQPGRGNSSFIKECQAAQPSCTHTQGCPAQAGGGSTAGEILLLLFLSSPSPSSFFLHHSFINFFPDLQCLQFGGSSPAAVTSPPAHTARGRRPSSPGPAAESCYRKHLLALLVLGNAD